MMYKAIYEAKNEKNLILFVIYEKLLLMNYKGIEKICI
jgi:hypothetical protein